MNNNKKQSNLQFTELAPDDIATHEDIYIDVLVGLAPEPTRISATPVPLSIARIYYEYAIKETLKAKQLFQETFG